MTSPASIVEALAMDDAARKTAALTEALRKISTLRPAGDVEKCSNPRKLVESMERIALNALSTPPSPAGSEDLEESIRRTQAFACTHALRKQQAADALAHVGESNAPAKVEAVARALCISRGLSPDTLYEHHEWEDWPVDERREGQDPFHGTTRITLMHRGWRKRVKDAEAAIAAMQPAKTIEARSVGTACGSDPKDESVVAKPFAQPLGLSGIARCADE